MIVMRPRALGVVFGGIAGLLRGRYGEPKRPSGADPRWELFALDVLSAGPLVTRRFRASAAQVRPARAFVAELLGDAHPRLADAVLLTSELAGNAVRHAAEREFSVSVLLAGEGVLVAVRDHGSSKIPLPRDAAEDETGGRGLDLVNALASRWGFHREATGGTVVWFQLPAGEARGPLG